VNGTKGFPQKPYSAISAGIAEVVQAYKQHMPKLVFQLVRSLHVTASDSSSKIEKPH
jgi:hypothetical protein